MDTNVIGYRTFLQILQGPFNPMHVAGVPDMFQVSNQPWKGLRPDAEGAGQRAGLICGGCKAQKHGPEVAACTGGLMLSPSH